MIPGHVTYPSVDQANEAAPDTYQQYLENNNNNIYIYYYYFFNCIYLLVILSCADSSDLKSLSIEGRASMREYTSSYSSK